MKKYLAALAIAASALSVCDAEEPVDSSSWKLDISFEQLPPLDPKDRPWPAFEEQVPVDLDDFSFCYDLHEFVHPLWPYHKECLWLIVSVYEERFEVVTPVAEGQEFQASKTYGRLTISISGKLGQEMNGRIPVTLTVRESTRDGPCSTENMELTIGVNQCQTWSGFSWYGLCRTYTTALRRTVVNPRDLRVLVPNPDPHSLWPFIPGK